MKNYIYLLLILFPILGCEQKTEIQFDSVVPVTIMELKKVSPKRETHLMGYVQPWKSEKIGFEVSGKVLSTLEVGNSVEGRIHDNNNKTIRKGSIIAQLNPARYQIAISSEVARVTGAQASLIEAQMDYERHTKLISSGSVSQAQFDKSKAAYLTAQSNLQQSEASLADAHYNFNHCTLRAPFSGVIEELFVAPGAWVQSGQAVVKLTMMKPIKVTVPVSANLAREIKSGDAVYIYPPGSTEPVGGLIDNNSIAADPETRTFNIDIFVQNLKLPVKPISAEKNQTVLKDENMMLTLNLTPEDTNSPVCVPLSSLLKDEKGYYVWRAKGQHIFEKGKALPDQFEIERINVIPGNKYRNFIIDNFRELTNSGGLKALDVVLINPPENLKNNETVIVEQTRWLFSPGDLARVRIAALEEVEGNYVPMSAIIPDTSGKYFVYLVENGKAKKIEVNIIGDYGDFRHISGKGISAGAKLITLGANYVYDGVKVSIVEKITKHPLE